jgi:hypothetical protein
MIVRFLVRVERGGAQSHVTSCGPFAGYEAENGGAVRMPIRTSPGFRHAPQFEKSPEMNQIKSGQVKANKPHAHFEAPHEVIVDPALSKNQKLKALDALEQDARQLAVASDEGMGGGEPTQLHEVLQAKETLAMLPTAQAYAIVLTDLQAKLKADEHATSHAVVAQALAALDAVAKSPAGQAV